MRASKKPWLSICFLVSLVSLLVAQPAFAQVDIPELIEAEAAPISMLSDAAVDPSDATLTPLSTDSWDLHYDQAWIDATSAQYSTQSVFEIYTAEEFAAFAYLTSNWDAPFTGKTIKLMNDIDISEYVWLSIAYNSTLSFGGVFDGNNRCISGMRLIHKQSIHSDGATMNGSGLFRFVYGGTIKNLSVDDALVELSGSDLMPNETNHIGIVAAAGRGATFENITVKNSTMKLTDINCDGWNSAGGLVGSLNFNVVADRSTVDNCKSINTTIEYNTSGGGYMLAIGGLVGSHGYAYNMLGGPGAGSSPATVKNSHVTDLKVERTVRGSGAYWAEPIGGLVGRSDGLANSALDIVDCSATYDMSFVGDFYSLSGFLGVSAGGVIGSIDGQSTILRCSAMGKVTCDVTGGLAELGLFAGGIAGQAGNWADNSRVYGSSIKSCFSSMEFSPSDRTENREVFGNVIGLRIKPRAGYEIEISNVFCFDTLENKQVSGETANASGSQGTIDEHDVYFIYPNTLHEDVSGEPFEYVGFSSDGASGVIDDAFLFAYSDYDTTGTITDNGDGTITGTQGGDGYRIGGTITKTNDAEIRVPFVMPINIIPKAQDYTVTKELADVSISDSDTSTITSGGLYVGEVSASENYSLPDTITITMGGTLLVQGVDFSYDKTSGEIRVPNVTGNLVIKVVGIKDPDEVAYTVTYDGNGVALGVLPIDNTKYEANDEVTIMAYSLPQQDRYEFIGWCKEKNGSGAIYSVDDTFVITQNTILYAQWKVIDTPPHEPDNPGTSVAQTTERLTKVGDSNELQLTSILCVISGVLVLGLGGLAHKKRR